MATYKLLATVGGTSRTTDGSINQTYTFTKRVKVTKVEHDGGSAYAWTSGDSSYYNMSWNVSTPYTSCGGSQVGGPGTRSCSVPAGSIYPDVYYEIGSTIVANAAAQALCDGANAQNCSLGAMRIYYSPSGNSFAQII